MDNKIKTAGNIMNIDVHTSEDIFPRPTWIKASGPPRISMSINTNTKVGIETLGDGCKMDPETICEELPTITNGEKGEKQHIASDGSLDAGTGVTRSAVKCRDSKKSVLPHSILEKVANFARDNPARVRGEGNHVIDSGDQEVTSSKDQLSECNQDLPLAEEGDQASKKDVHGKKRKKKTYKRKHSDSLPVADEEEVPKKSRPNYFIAVQVTNPQIHQRLEKVQEWITSQEPALASTVIPLPTLHLTLMVMNLADEQEITKACQVLQNCSDYFAQYKEKLLELKFKEISNFRNDVVFAKVEEGENLKKLKHIADTVRERFTDAEIASADDRDFKAHVTLMKISRGRGNKLKGIKKIKPHLYKEFSMAEFGSQTVRGVQLCSMMKPKDPKGYYQVESQIDFVPGDFQDPKDKYDANPIHLHVDKLNRILAWDFYKPDHAKKN